MLELAKDGFTREQIVATLHSPSLTYGFRYELLDGLNRRKNDLTNVLKAKIDHSALSEIKRTARFTLTEDDVMDIDFLNDRIKPYMRIKIPEGRVHSGANDWVEYPLGVFLLASPIRKDDGNIITRNIEAYDGLIVLRDDKFVSRHTVTAGTRHYDAITAILASAGITHYNIEQSDAVLTRDIEFEPGTEKLRAINDLLGQLNYVQLHVDVNGYYTSYVYRTPSERAADYAYADDALSITFAGAEEELDLFGVHNVFTVVRSNEEEPPLISTFVNDNPNSPTSTVSRGRIISDVREVDDIASQEALDAYVKRIAFEASQVYGRIRFNTQLMPMHGYSDVLQVDYSPLGISGKYVELNWSMDLRVGGVMTHEVRQIVDVGGGSV